TCQRSSARRAGAPGPSQLRPGRQSQRARSTTPPPARRASTGFACRPPLSGGGRDRLAKAAPAHLLSSTYRSIVIGNRPVHNIPRSAIPLGVVHGAVELWWARTSARSYIDISAADARLRPKRHPTGRTAHRLTRRLRDATRSPVGDYVDGLARPAPSARVRR